MAPPRYLNFVRPCVKRYIKKLTKELKKERANGKHLRKRLRAMTTNMYKVQATANDATRLDAEAFQRQTRDIQAIDDSEASSEVDED